MNGNRILENTILKDDGILDGEKKVTKSPTKCPRCGYENPHDAFFCGGCALRLTREEVERYARIHESLHEMVSLLKKSPKLKDVPEWIVEDAILGGFRKALLEFVNSPEYKEKLRRSDKKEGMVDMEVIKHRNSITTRTELFVSIPQGALIDIETTGLNEGVDEIITFGFISGNRLSVIQRKVKDKQPFYDEIKGVLDGLSRPFYAYNCEFEEKFFKEQLGIQLKATDLMAPWRKLAEHKAKKWPKLEELVSEPEMYFGVTRISAKDIPTLWNAFLSGGDEKLLEMIMKHNKADLLRGLYLLVQYPHLYELERETE
jgi:uncharacterized protein YprB with RNaseH-like and TPR domain/ribosomal protein S27AE